MLLVEGILAIYGWGLEEWDALYDDLPSRQTKLKVKDRSVVTTIPDETKTTAPEALQPGKNYMINFF